MDRTRRTVLAAAGTVGGTMLALSFWRGAGRSRPNALSVAPEIGGATAPSTAAVSTKSAEIRHWESLLNQKMVLSANGQSYEAYVAEVLPQAMPTQTAVAAVTRPTRGASRGGSLGALFRGATPASAATTAATLPPGIRPQSFAVRFEVHSRPAPTTDTLLDMDRTIEGLRSIFVQPATPWNDKPMVVAIFG